ncbi:MAG TPA: LytTR family DNA-binding domain-containing protein [Chitinophagaceae bacterium]|nr:LytTR family DNA-binding domain-containing protein [Chitinophagaceae bacterium]
MHDKKIICLAVDDEPPALEVLKKYIGAMPNLQLAGTCADALEALTVLQQHAIDLLFLDIQMPQLFGTDLVRTLKNPPKVIFTTAFRKFAVEGFELDAVDYLLKPISFERFLKAVNKVMGAAFQTAILADANNNIKNNHAEGYISLRADRKNLKIPLHDILYIESLKDYIKVVTISKTVIAKQSISSLEEMLPKGLFIRIHRSYIVSLDKIESYTNDLVGIGKQELPISRMYRYEVNKILKPD